MLPSCVVIHFSNLACYAWLNMKFFFVICWNYVYTESHNKHLANILIRDCNPRKKLADSDSGFFCWFLALQMRIQIRLNFKGEDSDSRFLADQIPIFSQHKYLNFKIGKSYLEWQIKLISTNDKTFTWFLIQVGIMKKA